MARSSALVAALCVHGTLGAFLSAPHAALSAGRPASAFCPASRPARSESGGVALGSATCGAGALLSSNNIVDPRLRPGPAQPVLVGSRRGVGVGVFGTQCALVTDKNQEPRRRSDRSRDAFPPPVITTIPTVDVTDDPAVALRCGPGPQPSLNDPSARGRCRGGAARAPPVRLHRSQSASRGAERRGFAGHA